MIGRLGALAPAALTIVLLAGCGGSSSSSKSSSGGGGGALSDSAFIADAKAIVCPTQSKFEALKQPTDLPGLSTYANQAVGIIEGMKPKLAALKPPSDKQAAYGKALSALANATSTIKEVAKAAASGDVQRTQSLAKNLETFGSRFEETAKQLGGGEC